VVVEPGFWRGKRVLVTGHTGFKGSWLSLWLQDLGADVTGFSLPPPTTPSLYELARVEEGMVSISGDVREGEAVSDAIAEHRPEIVIHMAAQPIVRRSFREPVETYGTNVMGTVAVLDAVRQVGGVRVVVNVTSDKCYEIRDGDRGYREDDPKGGDDPYSSSKGCAELVTSAYRASFFSGSGDPRTALASVRAGNVIGGGDWGDDRLVPDVMRSALEGRSVVVRNPDAIRPWQHVLNPLSGYLLLAQKLWLDPGYADGWNFGPDEADERPVRWLVDRLIALWGDDLGWESGTQAGEPPETHALRLDSSKARRELGWSPRWGLDLALESIVDWYKAFRAGDDVREVALEQVHAFQRG
jgi:CDP-glucose 4,6-dehydratase